MTMLAAPAHSRHSRRARAIYGTLPATRSSGKDSTGSRLAELAMLLVFLGIVAGVIALRAWLHVPQF